MGGRGTELNSTWFRLCAAYEMPMSRIAICGVLWRSSVPSRFSRIKAAAAPEPVTELLVDAGAMYDIDSTGAQTFLELLDELKARDITMSMARVGTEIRDELQEAQSSRGSEPTISTSRSTTVSPRFSSGLTVLRPPAFWLLFRLEALQLANC